MRGMGALYIYVSGDKGPRHNKRLFREVHASSQCICLLARLVPFGLISPGPAGYSEMPASELDGNDLDRVSALHALTIRGGL